jgi:hypothetical protein
MKTLEKTFTANYDKTGSMQFTEQKREGNVACYERKYPDGRLHSYEVFEVKVIKAGAKLPNGAVVAEDYERYPGAASFGKGAYSVNTQERADFRYEELKTTLSNRPPAEVNADGDEVVVVRKAGRKAVIRPEMTFPEAEKWTMKDLLALNPAYTPPLLYVALQKKIAAKVVQCVGEQRVAGARGKPAKIYSLVKS